jgi:hypothetical protein
VNVLLNSYMQSSLSGNEMLNNNAMSFMVLSSISEHDNAVIVFVASEVYQSLFFLVKYY